MHVSDSTFEIRGEFRGFFRDVFGKRRMVLRVDSADVFLKVPKELRHALADRLTPGDAVVARGTVEHEREGPLWARRLVSHVRLVSAPEVCAACPIHICTKKNCWRSGGRELWATLERRLAEAGLAGIVELKAVDCLDRCKQAPNADWNGRQYSRCRPHDVARIVAEAASLFPPKPAHTT